MTPAGRRNHVHRISSTKDFVYRESVEAAAVWLPCDDRRPTWNYPVDRVRRRMDGGFVARRYDCKRSHSWPTLLWVHHPAVAAKDRSDRDRRQLLSSRRSTWATAWGIGTCSGGRCRRMIFLLIGLKATWGYRADGKRFAMSSIACSTSRRRPTTSKWIRGYLHNHRHEPCRATTWFSEGTESSRTTKSTCVFCRM